MNGFMLPLDAGGEIYAGKIAEIFSSDENYYALLSSSRDKYDQIINWTRWAEEFKKICPALN